MLKQRIITALILAPVVLAGVFLLPPVAFAVFIGVIILIGAWEWAGLSGFNGWQRYIYALVLMPMLVGAWYAPATPILIAGLIWWILALWLVASYGSRRHLPDSSWLKALLGPLVLVPAWVGLLQLKLQPDSTYLISLLFFLIWGADIGAYFAGRAFGRHKLAPDVSPGKTWEGVAGGLLVAIVIYILMDAGYGTYQMFSQGWLLALLACVFIVLLSVLGDLTESLFKRERGIKDSSALLPGHGGILDRIDSLVAAAPVYSLLFLFLLPR